MVFAGERCFKLHRITFTAMGLWPYQKPFIWRLQAAFFFSMYWSSLIFQITAFMVSICDMDCIIKRISYICISMACILNYYCFYFNSEAIKQMFKHLQLDWNMYGNNDGIKIFEEYLSEAYIFALSMYMFLFIGIFLFVVFESRPIILDAFIPTNESRSRKVEVDIQLFVNEEEYFFLYLVQEIIGVFMGFCSAVTTGTFLATIAKHCCATYKIASFLIENTVTVRTLKIPVAERMQFMHRSICLSVYIHRRTMEFCKRLILSFDLWYLPLILLSVLFLSCVLLRLHNAMRQFNQFYDILISFVILCVCLIYLLVGNFLAQSYTEHSGKILEVTYNSLWYVAPLPIQKLFLIIQKSVQCHRIVMGGLFRLSVEGFSTVITSAISYFTFMNAIRS